MFCISCKKNLQLTADFKSPLGDLGVDFTVDFKVDFTDGFQRGISKVDFSLGFQITRSDNKSRQKSEVRITSKEIFLTFT